MLYVFHYDVAAIVVTSLMLLIFLLRNKYDSKSNGLFLCIIICNLLAALFDLISCFTISYPRNYALWFNYLVSLGYLLFYNFVIVFSFAYIDSKGKITRQLHLVKRVCIALFLFYIISICTSPFTHAVAYFDKNVTYCHGFLMPIFYAIPFLLFGWEIYIFYAARKRFNKYQIIASVFMIVSMAGSVALNIIQTRVITGSFTMSLIIIFIYVTFENPSYYCYLDTQCLNKRALHEKLHRMLMRDESLQGVVFSITNCSLFQYYYSKTDQVQLLGKVADILYRHYKTRVFFLSDDTFFIHTNEEQADIINQVWNLFAVPVDAETIRQKIELNFSTVDVKVSDVYDVELLIENIDDNVDMKNYQQKIDLLKKSIVHREEVVSAVKRAIQNDSFQVYFQPIRNLKTNCYDCAEALIRLRDDKLGFINPEEMIILSEQHGLINEVGEIVFRKVCKCIRDNRLEYLGVKYVDVNLSPIQCMTPTLSDTLFTIMNEYHIKPSQINLEITETAKSDHNMVIQNNINILSGHGVGFAIDDYGSGFATANYLFHYPISVVKIDKQILWQAMKDETALIVFQNMVELIKKLNKKIVVEGGETREMIDLLINEGCDYCQGYYFSKPLEEEAFINFLHANH
ncbi:MAG: EAL domain-containing protein [Lachnospiraceae bacterium]|nr:EAL domain-containing protein [Lachnospiraceae bacterium]